MAHEVSAAVAEAFRRRPASPSSPLIFEWPPSPLKYTFSVAPTPVAPVRTGSRPCRRLGLARHHRQHLHRRQRPSCRWSNSRENDVARLSPSTLKRLFRAFVDHIAIADRSALELEPQARQMPLKAQVRHHRGDHSGRQSASSRQFGDHRHHFDRRRSVAFSSTRIRSASPSSAMLTSACISRTLRQSLAAVEPTSKLMFSSARLVADHLGRVWVGLRRDQAAPLALSTTTRRPRRHFAESVRLAYLMQASTSSMRLARPRSGELASFGATSTSIKASMRASDLVGQFIAVRPEQLDAVVLIRIAGSGDHHAQVAAHRARQHRHSGRRHWPNSRTSSPTDGESSDQRIYSIM